MFTKIEFAAVRLSHTLIVGEAEAEATKIPKSLPGLLAICALALILKYGALSVT